MVKISRLTTLVVLFAILTTVISCGGGSVSSSVGGTEKTTTVKILHMNDTHSNNDADGHEFTFNGVATDVDMGGIARAAALIDHLKDDDTLVLHAGDAVQGTLYYTLSTEKQMRKSSTPWGGLT